MSNLTTQLASILNKISRIEEKNEQIFIGGVYDEETEFLKMIHALFQELKRINPHIVNVQGMDDLSLKKDSIITIEHGRASQKLNAKIILVDHFGNQNTHYTLPIGNLNDLKAALSRIGIWDEICILDTVGWFHAYESNPSQSHTLCISSTSPGP